MTIIRDSRYWLGFSLVLLLVAIGASVYVGRGSGEAQVQRDVVGDFEVQAEEGIDRNSEDWLKEYCLDRVEELAWVPVAYGRDRGPYHVFEPMEDVERYANYATAETCDKDFYYFDVVDEAFLDMGMEHRYDRDVWGDFQQAVAASISAQLTTAGFVEEGRDESGDLELRFSRLNGVERIREYVDVYFFENEEVLFELLVVSN